MNAVGGGGAFVRFDGVSVRYGEGASAVQALDRADLAFGRGDGAGGLMFRLAVETDGRGAVSRVVFLALRGEEGRVECFWPVPLGDAPPPQGERRPATGVAAVLPCNCRCPTAR